MQTLLHLRHAEREPGGVDLTPRGRAQAAALGRRLPRFDRVVTSPRARAVQTAEAMGYAVDAQLPELLELPEPASTRFDREPPASFEACVRLVDGTAELRANAEALAARWAEETDRLAEAGRLLIVSHGGIIELGTVGAIGSAARTWGPALERLEGVELRRASGRWVGGSVLRSTG